LVSQYDPARARADRDARASSAVNAVNVERRSDIADLTEKVGARGADALGDVRLRAIMRKPSCLIS